ncbi:DUF4153 domain-containing protein [Nocardia sp. NPDC058633]|uniref:DUF4153 domain-containing protein n=1 Tax=Nocardia sp. NPDC058633 TaxID=3346568 RepID=UPI00364E091C
MPDTSLPEGSTPDRGAADKHHAPARAAADQPGTGPVSAAATDVAPETSGTANDPLVGATESGARSTAVLTKNPAAADVAAPSPVDTVPPAASRAVRRPDTTDSRAGAWPNAVALPPPLPPVPPRWQRVARPPGVLPAAALAGVVGATVIPLDRPGIGWLIAGTAVTGALCVVDYRARTRGTSGNDPAESAAPSGTSSADTPVATNPSTADDAAAEPAQSASPPGHDALAPHSGAVAAAAESSATGHPADPDLDEGTESASAAEGLAAARPTPAAGSTAPKSALATGATGAADAATEASASGARTSDPSVGSGGTGLPADTSAKASTADRNEPPKDVAAQPVALRDRAWLAAAALLLLGVGTVRAAGWLFVLCVLAACVAGSLAVLGRRSTRGIVHDVLAVPLATFGAVPWAFSELRESRSAGTSSVRRYGISVAATAALLVVFVPLLGGADATFAGLLNGLVPRVDGPAAWQWIFLFALVAVGVLGALYLLAGPPAGATDSARPRRLWSRSEWMLPVGALTVLFAVFVGAQFVALFGGDDYVQRTAGLTYAEYARSGFWQLSAVSVLTLAVILAVLHWSARDTAADRRSLRILLSAVSVLALVIVCSALGRMWTYQQAYGFTVLRLLVTTCELWVGLVYVLVLIAVARLHGTWVPRAAIGTALATLIALAVLNPEHLVAERNIDRWQTSGRLDADYLSNLSPDILPALDPLPAHLRTDIETPILDDLDEDHWWSWNWSRSSAG